MSNRVKNNQNGISWKDFFLGFFLAMSLCLVGFLLSGTRTPKSEQQGNSTSNNTTKESSDSGLTLNQYQTDIKEFTLELENGESLNFYTPENWCSLTDQYLESLNNFYEADLPSGNTICVGDSANQYNASILISARPLSGVSEVMKAIYDDEYDPDVMLYSEAYTYMKTGSLPEELPDNYAIKELQTMSSKDGHIYRLFYVYFTQEYYTDDTRTNTITIPSEQLMAYSDTEDAVEVICYGNEFDVDFMKNYFAEFIGFEDPVTSEAESIEELKGSFTSNVNRDEPSTSVGTNNPGGE